MSNFRKENQRISGRIHFDSEKRPSTEVQEMVDTSTRRR